MGYSVQLLSGGSDPRSAAFRALRLLKELDRTRDDLKGGWHRGPHGEQVPHWSFVDADIQVIADLPSMLRAFRFEPFVLAASGDIYGVELIGCTRKRATSFSCGKSSLRSSSQADGWIGTAKMERLCVGALTANV